MLDGEVEVGQDVPRAGHNLQQLVGDVVVETIEEAHPEVALQAVQRAQQGGERRAVAEVFAVGRDVLRHQVELTRAGREQGTSLPQQGLGGAAAQMPAELRDGAEGTGVVAPLGDFHIGEGWPREAERGHRFVEGARGQPRRDGHRHGAARGQGGQDLGQVVELIHAQEGVHLRKGLGHPPAVALGHAARDDHGLAGAVGLVGAGGEDVLRGLGAGGLDEGAGVHEDDVGAVGRRRERVTGLQQRARHHLAVGQVLGAAERDHPDGFQSHGGTLRDRGLR